MAEYIQANPSIAIEIITPANGEIITLEQMQQCVGGDIEAMTLTTELMMYVNKERSGKRYNHRATMKLWKHHPEWKYCPSPILGDVLIATLAETGNQDSEATEQAEQATTSPHCMENFTITQRLSREQLSDVLCSALEGGSNYWYSIEEYVEPTSWQFDSLPLRENGHWSQDYPLNPGGALLISDTDDSDHAIMRLDWQAIQKGLDILAAKYPTHLADILGDDADAVTGDVFLQCCLFGEVIYG